VHYKQTFKNKFINFILRSRTISGYSGIKRDDAAVLHDIQRMTIKLPVVGKNGQQSYVLKEV
jgi:hypothetical protein